MGNDTATLETPAAEDIWREIEELVDEIARLSKSDVASSAFYTELLSGAVSALAAAGGLVWTVKPGPEIELEYQINLAATHLTDSDENWRRHAELIYTALEAPGAKAILPRSSGQQTSAASNPSEFLLLICPLFVEGQAVGVIEVFQRPGTSRAAQGGYLRFLDALAELACDFHRNRQLRQLQDRAGAWGQFEQFAEKVHGSLDVDATAYFVANEGRRLIGCDRLSVLRSRGRRQRMLAVSGLDTFDRRANVIRRGEHLAAVVVRGGEPLWYNDADATPVPPQIEAALQPYLDESHARQVAVLPLTRPLGTKADSPESIERETIGALLVERFEVEARDAGLKHRVEAVRRHSELAVSNALAHRELPLYTLARLLQKAGWFTKARNLPKTTLALLLLAAVAGALFFIPVDFNISGRGELQPERRRDVFAPSNGIIVAVYAQHSEPVAAGDQLVQLRNLDLEYKFKEVAGELQTVQQRLKTIGTARIGLRDSSSPDARAEDQRLSAELGELEVRRRNLTEQFAVLRELEKELLITSPLSGEVLTWDVDRTLDARPVQRGDNLLRIADRSGPWVLEIQVPDDHIGHVLAARERLRRETEQDGVARDLPVSFVLASDPDVTYAGTVEKIDMSTRTNETEGATVLVTVQFDRSQIDHMLLRPGIVAIPRIYCGRRPLGYVWFHNLLDAVKTRILF